MQSPDQFQPVPLPETDKAIRVPNENARTPRNQDTTITDDTVRRIADIFASIYLLQEVSDILSKFTDDITDQMIDLSARLGLTLEDLNLK